MDKKAIKYYNEHKGHFLEWNHGRPVKSWMDREGIFCIKYQDGKWWHYKEHNGNLEWW